MEHAPRHDENDVDPTGLKPKLAIFANSTFRQMWNNSTMRDSILIGKHSLDCEDKQKAAWYRSDHNGMYDGVHMYGSQGVRSYSKSVTQIMKSLLPTSSNTPDHSSCPQTLYQNKRRNMTTSGQQKNSVPVSNKFETLGN
jgi:hypothetical protein